MGVFGVVPGPGTDNTGPPLSNAAPLNVDNTAANAGVSTDCSRADHKHDVNFGTPGAIQPDDTADAGVATTLALSDHRHSIVAGTPVTVTASTNSEGVATTFARGDHQHALGLIVQSSAALIGTRAALNFVGATVADDAGNNRVNVTVISTPLATVAPVNVDNTAAAIGVSTEAARADHHHDVNFGTPGTISVGDAASGGSATTIALSDHTHALTAPAAPANVTKAAASAGAATTVARSDHKHDVTTAAPGTILPDDAAAEGTATSLARSDHTHAIAAATPVSIGAANSEGVSTSFARADHVHDGTATQVALVVQTITPTSSAFAAYQILNTDDVIMVTFASYTGGGTYSLLTPQPSTYKKRLTIKIKGSLGTCLGLVLNDVTFAGDFDGVGGTYSLETGGLAVTIISDGTGWWFA